MSITKETEPKSQISPELKAERASYAGYHHDLTSKLAFIVTLFTILRDENFDEFKKMGFDIDQMSALFLLIRISFLEDDSVVFSDKKIKNIDNLNTVIKNSKISKELSDTAQGFFNNPKNQQNETIKNYFQSILIVIKNSLKNCRLAVSSYLEDPSNLKKIQNSSVFDLFKKINQYYLLNAIETTELSMLLFNPDIGNVVLKSRQNSPVNEIVSNALKAVKGKQNHSMTKDTSASNYEYGSDSNSENLTMFSHTAAVTLALENYISNAAKYSFLEKQKQARVNIRTIETDDFVAIAVVDNGRGIKKMDRWKIFGAGYQTSNSIQSTGAGLWMVAIIINAHNGLYGVSSQENGGSSFYIAIPKKDKNLKESHKFISAWADQERRSLNKSTN